MSAASPRTAEIEQARGDLRARIRRDSRAFTAWVDACCARDAATSGDGAWQIAILVDALTEPGESAKDHEVSQLIARELPVRWLMIESHLRARRSSLAAVTPEARLERILEAHCALEFGDAPPSDAGPVTAEDPFGFLNSAGPGELARLFASRAVEPRRISLIGRFWTRGELSRVLQHASSDARKVAVLEFARLASVPPAVSERAARQFAAHLKLVLESQRERAAADDSRARFERRAISGARIGEGLERQLESWLETVDPRTAAALRARALGISGSLAYVSRTELAEALARLSPEDVAGALVGARARDTAAVLGALAPRARRSVEALLSAPAASSKLRAEASAAYRQVLIGLVLRAREERLRAAVPVSVELDEVTTEPAEPQDTHERWTASDENSPEPEIGQARLFGFVGDLGDEALEF